YLTNGDYDPEALRYYTAAGQERYYYASDDLQRPALFGLTPEDIIDLAVFHKLHFHGATQGGVVFHLIGAVSQFGKIGILCIADSHAASRALFKRTVRTLEEGNCLPDR
ncbi:MAG: peptide ligase PGM1-related protein, partial [Rhodothermales bacterium]